MKFYVKEHKAIKAAILAAGLEYTDFAFVKRKGNVHIIYQKGAAFVFHRRAETILNDAGQWEKVLEYAVAQPKQPGSLPDWGAVMEVFVSWLSELG